MNALQMITATCEPGNRVAEILESLGLDPSKAVIRGNKVLEYRGDVDISRQDLEKIPVEFVKVTGDFHCGSNQLGNLRGAPQEVGGSFYCYNNHLVNLHGAPREVGGDFYCNYNCLVSLEGAPETVGRSFYCYNNRLVSLRGAPREVGGDFYCMRNPGSPGFEKPAGVRGRFVNQ